MYPGSRTAASSVLGFTVAAGLVIGTVVSNARSAPQADDISDYDGTKCSADQMYDATAEQCASDVVTNDPQGAVDMSDFDGTSCPTGQFFDATSMQCATTAVTNDPQAPIDPNSVGISDPGKDCAETQLFNVPDMKCMPDLDTNDPQDVPTPEGENPTLYTVPKATDVPNCASGTDPLSICS
jgi:hypothetical protein